MEEIKLTLVQIHEFMKWVLSSHELMGEKWHRKNKLDEQTWNIYQLYDLYTSSKKLTRGDKVVYEGQVYDYGYVGQTGKAIIYEEGCQNMQDALAVDYNRLTRPL